MTKDYMIIATTMMYLTKDGWEFEIVDDKIVKATSYVNEYNEDVLESFRFCSEKEFKDWILKEKCMDY